jgi:hypothetical protein
LESSIEEYVKEYLPLLGQIGLRRSQPSPRLRLTGLANFLCSSRPGKVYNSPYSKFITDRAEGITTTGCLSSWIIKDGAAAIQKLLIAFGMNRRNSRLVPHSIFRSVLSALDPATIDWIAQIALPLSISPPGLMNPATGRSLAAEIHISYNLLARPGSVTTSGGYVAASKTMHCLFPNFASMIDGQHTGISYYNITRETYTPPIGLHGWTDWIGAEIFGCVNPSPRGAGRNGWQWFQFLASIGLNQHIYELWQAVNGCPGFQAFLNLDSVNGTIGIPRIIDKAFW